MFNFDKIVTKLKLSSYEMSRYTGAGGYLDNCQNLSIPVG